MEHGTMRGPWESDNAGNLGIAQCVDPVNRTMQALRKWNSAETLVIEQCGDPGIGHCGRLGWVGGLDGLAGWMGSGGLGGLAG